mmetsp:Transcript_62757/g.99506  ORF Transcript_62757/g.99506 Transcript_62757/m.99506 type:complete len:299 (-) Transcript_62757:225-1121(-)
MLSSHIFLDVTRKVMCVMLSHNTYIIVEDLLPQYHILSLSFVLLKAALKLTCVPSTVHTHDSLGLVHHPLCPIKNVLFSLAKLLNLAVHEPLCPVNNVFLHLAYSLRLTVHEPPRPINNVFLNFAESLSPIGYSFLNLANNTLSLGISWSDLVISSFRNSMLLTRGYFFGCGCCLQGSFHLLIKDRLFFSVDKSASIIDTHRLFGTFNYLHCIFFSHALFALVDDVLSLGRTQGALAIFDDLLNHFGFCFSQQVLRVFFGQSLIEAFNDLSSINVGTFGTDFFVTSILPSKAFFFERF